MKPLNGKVGIVTGAGRLRGIGRASALALAELGADVVITGTGRDPATFPDDEKAAGWKDIESTADQIRELGTRALPLVADATSAADAQRVADAAVREFGRIDFLVNNAAVGRGGDRVPITQLPEETWHRVLGVKLTGGFLMCRAVVPALIAHGEGGAIVNVSSVLGRRGEPNTAAYSAANAGLLGMTLSLAAELARHKIRVNAICPGLTATARMDVLGRGDAWQALLKTIPLQRAAEDDEVGRVIAWICSPAASYLTGQVINFDGGLQICL